MTNDSDPDCWLLYCTSHVSKVGILRLEGVWIYLGDNPGHLVQGLHPPASVSSIISGSDMHALSKLALASVWMIPWRSLLSLAIFGYDHTTGPRNAAQEWHFQYHCVAFLLDWAFISSIDQSHEAPVRRSKALSIGLNVPINVQVKHLSYEAIYPIPHQTMMRFSTIASYVILREIFICNLSYGTQIMFLAMREICNEGKFLQEFITGTNI